MSTIQELEQKVEQLEKDILAKNQKLTLLTRQAEKAIDYATHAYRVDHYGFIWVYNAETKLYNKTEMRLHTPEVPDKSIGERKLQDKAITSDKIADGAVTGDKIADKAVKGNNIADNAITSDKFGDNTIEGRSIKDNTIEGHHIQNNAIGIQHLKPGTIDESKIILSDVAIDFDERIGDILVYYINDCGVTDAVMNDEGDIILILDDSCGVMPRVPVNSVGTEQLKDKGVEMRDLSDDVIENLSNDNIGIGDPINDDEYLELVISNT